MTRGKYVRTEEIRQRISESLKGRVISEETRNKLSLVGTGRIHSLKTKQKISETQKKQFKMGTRSSWIKGKHLSEETKEKMRQSAIRRFSSEDAKKTIGLKSLGRYHSKETKRKISNTLKSLFAKEKINLSKGMLGKHHSNEVKTKLTILNGGRKPWIAGKHHKEETKKRISEANKGRKLDLSEDERKKRSERVLGINNPMFGNHCFSGEKHPNWLGGKSFEPYSPEFNRRLKEQIRIRDQHRCQQCFRHQDELRTKTNRGYHLTIHHIDYNKKNNNYTNLISLCRSCHAQTNYKREDWVKYFQEKTNRFESWRELGIKEFI